jgi:hypothetical protein
MKTKSGHLVVCLAVVVMLLAPVSPALGASPDGEVPSAPGEAGGGLFAASAAPLNPLLVSDPTTIRGRSVTVNLESLQGPGGIAERVVLNLFDDAVFTANLDRVESNLFGGYTWVGHLQGVDLSLVTLVVNEGVLVGKVAWPQGTYEVRYAGSNAQHTIVQIEQSAFAPELDPIPVEAGAGDRPPAGGVAAADDGSMVDVMVVYTDDARAAAGGTTAIENTILLAASETNTSYANSDINQRLTVVHMAEVSYEEAGDIVADLYCVRDPADDCLDQVHGWRNTYHADHVVMLTETSVPGNLCGVAWLQTNVGPGFEDNAFAVVKRTCATGYYSFGHELGHNMGARHDWYVDSGVTPYTYAHGYLSVADRWRSVMSYNNECAAAGVNCARLPYWSNPEVSFGGVPMGVPGGTKSDCVEGEPYPVDEDCDADNRSTLNNTAPTCAQFRYSANTWTGAVSTYWNEPDNWAMEEGVPGSTTTVHRVPRAIDDVLIPASAAQYPTISEGTANVRELIIEDGAQLNMTGGTLNVYGNWEVQGTGVFDGIGGTVAFVGSLDQTIVMNGSSDLYNLQIGDGLSTQTVAAGSDLDVNGNLTIETGASFAGGDNTLYVAGHWTDSGTGFVPGTSTVVFDGGTQIIDTPITPFTLLDEPFWEGDGLPCCSPVYLPAGWGWEFASGSGWSGGDLYDGQGGIAVRWNNTPDGWLFTTGVTLEPGFVYHTSFMYRTYSGNGIEDFSIWIGTEQNSGSMAQQVSSASSSSPTYATRTDTFTVDTAGTYYLGIRAQQASGKDYALVDEILLTATRYPAFYNMEVNSTIGATLSGDLAVLNDLAVNADAILDLSTHDVTVEGTVANNGTLRQQRDAPADATTQFLRITNADDDATQYHGVDITPEGDLGATTVEIRGNQAGCTTDPTDALFKRCYDITPTSTENADVRFWFTEAERNDQVANAVVLWHWGGLAWDQPGDGYTYSEAGETCTSGGGTACWIEVSNIDGFSPFASGDDGDPPAPPGPLPTGVVLLYFHATPADKGAIALDWETATEIDNAGFHLYRAETVEGTLVRLNEELIPSQAPPGSPMGALYTWLDGTVEEGVTYYYWLEGVDLQGFAAEVGQASAALPTVSPYRVYLPAVNK